MVPDRISKWDLVTKRLQRFLLLLFNWCGCWGSFSLWCRWGGGRCGRCGGLLGVERADLELGLILLEDALVVVLPELFAGILACDTGEDLLSAW